MIAYEESEGRMTPEQMERAIEFLLNHHARFITELDLLKDTQAQTSKDVAEMADVTKERITNLADAILSLTNIVSEHGDQIAALAAQGKKTDSQIAALNEQGKETDARLNALIHIVKRHITNTTAHEDKE